MVSFNFAAFSNGCYAARVHNVVYAFHQQNSTDGKVNKSQVSDLKYVDQSARPKLVS